MSKDNLIIKTKIEEKDMYNFLKHYAFSGLRGIFLITISCLGFTMFLRFYAYTGINMYTVLWLLIALNIFITPITLKKKAKRTIRLQPAYKEPFEYIFNKDGFSLKQNKSADDYKWEDIYKVEQSKEVVLIYFDKKTAIFIPRAVLGEKEKTLKEYFKKYLTPKQYKIKL